MSKSARLRIDQWRAIVRLVRECRELGDDAIDWRQHALRELARLTDSDLGMAAEGAGCRALRPTDLGVTCWAGSGDFDPSVHEAHMAEFRKDPTYCPTQLSYFERMARDDGACLSRTDLVADRSWYRSADYQVIQRSFGMDHILFCFRSLPLATADDESAGLILIRAQGRGDFDRRDLALVREAHAALAPLIGGPLARFTDPSPADLAPRVKEVLRCLLEGDGDKQVAARLGLSVHTVNEYTKTLFRHFGVKSRTELLARWIRRNRGERSLAAD